MKPECLKAQSNYPFVEGATTANLETITPSNRRIRFTENKKQHDHRRKQDKKTRENRAEEECKVALELFGKAVSPEESGKEREDAGRTNATTTSGSRKATQKWGDVLKENTPKGMGYSPGYSGLNIKVGGGRVRMSGGGQSLSVTTISQYSKNGWWGLGSKRSNGKKPVFKKLHT